MALSQVRLQEAEKAVRAYGRARRAFRAKQESLKDLLNQG